MSEGGVALHAGDPIDTPERHPDRAPRRAAAAPPGADPAAPVPSDPRLRLPTAFDVFDDRGRYRGRLGAGMPLSGVRVVGDRLYGVTRDELGVSYLVRVRIVGR